MNEDKEVVVPETTEEVTPEVTSETTEEETVEEVKAKLAKATELADNYKVRAEKAEKKAKEVVQPATEAKGDLSSKDIIAINRANIHEDDLDEVIDYAKYKKISIGEALKSGVVKTLLKDKEEQRKTAAATNTGTARRSSVKVSDEEVVAQSERGQVPEDPEVLARARMNLRKKK
jgi:hypothetical protein